MPLLFTGILLGAVTSFSAYFFYNLESPVATSLLARATYGALHRGVWAVGLGLFVLAVTAGNLSKISLTHEISISGINNFFFFQKGSNYIFIGSVSLSESYMNYARDE